MTEGILERKTVYLAGKMSGLPQFGAPIFNAAAADLRQRGYRVINPVDLDLEVGFDPSTDSPEDFDLPAAVRRDVDALIGCDAIAMLPGHETSKGATAERHVAIWLGLPVLSYPSMVPLEQAKADDTNQHAPYCWENAAMQREQMKSFYDAMDKRYVRTQGLFSRVQAGEAKQLTEDGPGGDSIVPDLSPGEWTELLNAASEYSERTPVKVEPAELKAQIAYGWSRNWDSAIDGGDDSGCVPTGHEKLTEANAATLKDGDTTTNERGGKQSHLSARFDCIPPEVLKLLAQCLGFGAKKYGPGNWKNIDQEDNLAHAMNHINEYRLGDRSEPHLVNTMARVTFALWQAIEKGDQPTMYIHPDMVASK